MKAALPLIHFCYSDLECKYKFCQKVLQFACPSNGGAYEFNFAEWLWGQGKPHCSLFFLSKSGQQFSDRVGNGSPIQLIVIGKKHVRLNPGVKGKHGELQQCPGLFQ